MTGQAAAGIYVTIPKSQHVRTVTAAIQIALTEYMRLLMMNLFQFIRKIV